MIATTPPTVVSRAAVPVAATTIAVTRAALDGGDDAVADGGTVMTASGRWSGWDADRRDARPAAVRDLAACRLPDGLLGA
nr:hypothetical protein GCM10025699_52280 [Microbacterium flavescens]